MEDKVRLLKLPIRKTKTKSYNLVCKNICFIYKGVLAHLFRYWKLIFSIIAVASVLVWTHSYSISHEGNTLRSELNSKAYPSKLFTKSNNLLNVLRMENRENVTEFIKFLHWTPYYDSTDLGFDTFTCSKNRRCKVTFNKTEVESVDAVIFSAVDMQYEKSKGIGYTLRDLPAPNRRRADVPWIISLFESPEHVPVDLRLFHGIFNYTWSFRRDSDFHSGNLYEKIVSGSSQDSVEKIKGPIDISKKKNKTAAWIVSNCDMQPSNRNYLVKLLREYIDIDVYGHCGTKSCSNVTGVDCYGKIANEYKFYLSFENSLCFDYVTEKFPAALDAGMVPVIYGFGNLSEPQGAFINVFDFDTVEDLAKRLLYLSENLKEYKKYFEWRKFYRRVPENNFLCPVCEKMWDWRENINDGETQTKIKKLPKTYEFLWDWWVHTTNKKGQKIWACSRPGYHLKNLKQVFSSWWDWTV